MIETIVAVVGALSALAGIGVGIAGYRNQAAQLRRQIVEAELARRVAVAAEDRASQDARRRAAQEEEEHQRNERLALIMHARCLRLWADGSIVRAAYDGRFPVTDVRVFWRDTEITPGGQGFDLYHLPGARSDGAVDTVLAPVPGLPEGQTVYLSDIHADFTDMNGRRWRRRGNGALLQQVDGDHWDSSPTAWTEEYERNLGRDFGAASPSASTVFGVGSASRSIWRKTLRRRPILALVLLGIGIACLAYLAL
ncbi:hypothetical protein ACWC5I_03545 [Kitasatospora sp. NPDC001574]